MNEVNKVTKEDYKRYYSSCWKKAWAFHSLKNFEKLVQLIKDNQIVSHFSFNSDSGDDFDTSEAFNPIELYENILLTDDNELDKEKLYQKKLLIEELEKVNGFELSGVHAEAIRDGQEFGEISKEYFIEKLYKENLENNTNFEYLDLQEEPFEIALIKTNEALRNNKIKYIFEPAFSAQNSMLNVRCDILINNGNNNVSIVEAKASTKAKKEHFFDLLYQKKVLEKNNLLVNELNLCLINSEYVRGLDNALIKYEMNDEFVDEEKLNHVLNNLITPKWGCDDIDYSKIVKITNEFKEGVSFERLILIWETNVGNFDEEILKINSFLNNESALFLDYCKKITFKISKNKIIVEDQNCYHIVPYYDKEKFNLYDITRFKNKAIIVHQRNPEKIYIENIHDLKDQIFLNKKNEWLFKKDHKRIIEVVQSFLQTNKYLPEKLININKIDVLMKLLKKYYNYPIYMYDFETVKWAIPKYNNSWSYQQIPFQYSIHIIKDDNFDFNRPNETMEHENFIASKVEDPRPEFVVNFIKSCFKYGKGTYVAYNDSFEKGIIKNLIYSYPEFKEPLLYIYKNTIDLMNFFMLKDNNWLIYHPEFKGSYSIKKTQPALDSSLNYKDLRINKGDKASETFRQFLDEIIDHETFNKLIKDDMLKYCDRDTLAMVVILQKVIEIVKNYDSNFLKNLNKY